MMRFLRWLNRVLNVVETDPYANARYAAADEYFDRIEAASRAARRGPATMPLCTCDAQLLPHDPMPRVCSGALA